jgi:TPP-dependent pyruvate/acetoin dehydrogenase alpha subunit
VSRAELHRRIYRSLYRIRRAEEEIARIYPSDKIKSPVHLSIGQESASVGVCEALRPEDTVFGTYRGHALYLAKGGDLPAMMAELYGKATGCAAGKGGSMHLVDPDAGVMGCSAVVATTIPHAVGYAYAAKLRGEDTAVAVFFGDGAVEEGVFHESLNFAALHRLPVLFVCENNLYAIHTHQRDRQPLGNIYERGAIYGIPGRCIEDGDVVELHDAAADALAALRRGEGPRLIETRVYRWKEHVGPLDELGPPHRSSEEARAWVDRDQLAAVCEQLESDERDAIESKVERELAEAIRFAEESPFPDVSALHTHVFGA